MEPAEITKMYEKLYNTATERCTKYAYFHGSVLMIARLLQNDCISKEQAIVQLNAATQRLDQGLASIDRASSLPEVHVVAQFDVDPRD